MLFGHPSNASCPSRSSKSIFWYNENSEVAIDESFFLHLRFLLKLLMAYGSMGSSGKCMKIDLDIEAL